jgi:hypothetical protein
LTKAVDANLMESQGGESQEIIMDALSSRRPPSGGALQGLVWLVGAAGSLVAGAIAAVLAVVFTAALAMVAVMGMALVGLTVAALRGRSGPRGRDPDLIEARNVGGHSWVAYGWDQDGRQA